MATTNDRDYFNRSTNGSFSHIKNWMAAMKNQPIPPALNYNFKLNAEIHLAISEQIAEHISAICAHLFALYRHTTHRSFVLQFLPSFIMTYYDVLHHHHQLSHPELVDAATKDVYSTIDTFLVSLYSLGVIDDRQNDKNNEIRIPNLTQPSIYHIPNLDHYTPLPLTRNVISRHENKPEVICSHVFAPFDSMNPSNSGNDESQIGIGNRSRLERMLWFLLIQYGNQVSLMDELSYQAYIRMATKLLAQGFPFDTTPISTSNTTNIRLKRRRIQISSQMMAEILGTLIYIKTVSENGDVCDSMRLLKQRAEYELFPDVILMTESLEYLHQFETQPVIHQSNIGIEIELPPTAEMTRQKRIVTTARSLKSRQRTQKADESISDENSITDTLTFVSETNESIGRRRGVLNAADNTEIRVEPNSSTKNHFHNGNDINFTPTIDKARTYIASSIGPARSSASPAIDHHFKSTYIRGTPPPSPISHVKSDRRAASHESDRSSKSAIVTTRYEKAKGKSTASETEETYL